MAKTASKEPINRTHTMYKCIFDKANMLLRCKPMSRNKWHTDAPNKVKRFFSDPFYRSEPCGFFHVDHRNHTGAIFNIPDDVPQEQHSSLDPIRIFYKELKSFRNPFGSVYVERLIKIVDGDIERGYLKWNSERSNRRRESKEIL